MDRRRLLQSSAAVFTAALTAAAAQRATASPSNAGIDWRWGVQVPMRDGVRLHGVLYLPAGPSTARPCLLGMTPYNTSLYHETATYFAGRGYAVLSVDVRGRGNSEGAFTPFLREAHDGADAVAWLARQPFCNGKIGMWGGSYGGYAQWMTAGQAPAALATIVPTAAPFAGVDLPKINNIPSSYALQWLSLVGGRTLQIEYLTSNDLWRGLLRENFVAHRPFGHLARYAGDHADLFTEWLAHEEVDAYFDRYNNTDAQYAAIEKPVLTITGLFDSDQPGALAHYRRHLAATSRDTQSRHYLVIGPWDHAQTRAPKGAVGGLTFGAASRIDIPALHVQWFDWTLRGGPRPPFLRKSVAYYMPGAEEWRYAESLQVVTGHFRALHLASDGSTAGNVFDSGELRMGRGSGGPDRYVYDPMDVGSADRELTGDGSELVDQRPALLSDESSLFYHSAPLQEHTDLAGFPRLVAFISLDQPDTDFLASISVIGPDGQTIKLADTVMRARFRNGARRAELAPVDQVVRYEFAEFPFVARRLLKGSRIRLALGALNSPHFQKNYNTGGATARDSGKQSRPVTVTLHHDQTYPSALHLPIAASG